MSFIGPARLGRSPGKARKQVTETHELSEIVIGKDVLELVSSAMYVDPITIYREYIQNAADALDLARIQGSLGPDEPGRVDIMIDSSTRTVRIKDNGSGLAFSDFGRKLTALGGSSKRGTSARGFRGVGRLAGLGYAQELIFRSRVDGETNVSELRWDCRRLKVALLSADQDSGVADLIRSVTTLARVEAGGAPARFFEVEMRGIIRLRNDRLMSPLAIADYLSEVAPVPFAPTFKFASRITDALRDFVDLSSLEIRIDSADSPIYRPHRDSFNIDGTQSVTFDSLDLIEIPGIDGEVAAAGWVIHHEYDGALPTAMLVKGLRLRSGNIQVGDHTLLEELFPEPRFNAWSVGEIHVIDKRVVPNGRRDHFEQNAHYHNLINHLAPTARDIARRCRTNSIRRKWLRELELHAQSVEGTIDVISQGSVSRSGRQRLALQAEQTLMQMVKIAEMDLIAELSSDRNALIAKFKEELGVAMNDESAVSSPLMRLSKAQRKTYEHLFELIYECSVNRVAAKALIDRILMRLK